MDCSKGNVYLLLVPSLWTGVVRILDSSLEYYQLSEVETFPGFRSSWIGRDLIMSLLVELAAVLVSVATLPGRPILSHSV